MSMIGNFRRLSDADLERLLTEPDVIRGYLYPDDEDEPVHGFGPFQDLDVDKAWHGIHFLLTNTAWEGEGPLAFVVNGGTPIGEEDEHDVGYGPARGFTSGEVREIADALAVIGPDALAARFDPQAMTNAEVYPAIWHRDPNDDDTRGYVLEYYAQLRTFVAEAAAAGHAMLVWLN